MLELILCITYLKGFAKNKFLSNSFSEIFHMKVFISLFVNSGQWFIEFSLFHIFQFEVILLYPADTTKLANQTCNKNGEIENSRNLRNPKIPFVL